MIQTQTNPDARCPACQKTLDAATSTHGKRGPKEGDYSVCMYCGNLNIFLPDLTVRSATEQEMDSLDADTKGQIFKMRLALARSRVAKDS